MFGLQKLISFKDTLKCFFGIFVDDLDCKKTADLLSMKKTTQDCNLRTEKELNF